MNEIFADEEKTKNYKYGLVDYYTTDKLDMSVKEIISLAKMHLDISKLNKNIIVGFAIKRDVVYGFVRVWEVYAEMTGWDVKIKRTLPEIKEWLGKKLDLSF